MDKKTDNYSFDNNQGQTVLETALMIILLLMLVFGIAEISRAWWLKNQVNNAARVGVRVAVVLSNTVLTQFALTGTKANGSCPYTDPLTTIRGASCGSITGGGLTNVTVVTDDGSGGTPSDVPGSTIRVIVRGTFQSVVPNLLGGIPGLSGAPTLLPGLDAQGRMTLSSSSVMRHE